MGVIAAFRTVVAPYRRHSQRFCRFEVLRHVLDHRRTARVDFEAVEEPPVAMCMRLGLKLGGMDVVKLREMLAYPERFEHSPRIGFVGVGEDQLAARQAGPVAGPPGERES